ncbi:hypothetical protein CEXT_228841 [Caerostris extrusa]|uniref:Ycf15 n=1 Tax=Caerostris extrusa TaxID=172846 RepID=A0AAV4NPC0_CAEEX|nr:hypothetical protein CEXT_228841 [Caerostris extrusa]
MILIYLSTPRIPSGQARTWLMQIYGDLGKYLNSHSRGKSHFKRFIFASQFVIRARAIWSSSAFNENVQRQPIHKSNH